VKYLFNKLVPQKLSLFKKLESLHTKSMKCPKCQSTEISKNGTRNGKQNFICKHCGRQFLDYSSSRGYPDEIRQICLRMRRQGMAYRKIEALTGVNHNTIISWNKDTETRMEEIHIIEDVSMNVKT
jgi:transposase-like protein